MALKVVGGFKLGFPQTQFPVIGINHEKPKSHKLKIGFSSSGSNHHSFKLGLSCGKLKVSSSDIDFTELLEPFRISRSMFKDLNEADINLLEALSNATSHLLFGHSKTQSFFIAVRIPDDNGPVVQTINKITDDMDPFTLRALVFNEVLPCLVDNASDWISTALLVSANYNEDRQKLAQYRSDPYIIYPGVMPIPVNAEASHTPCTEVYVHFVFNDVLNMEGINTREDLILFLRKLKSLTENIFGTASAVYEPALLAKEKMETYSHTRI